MELQNFTILDEHIYAMDTTMGGSRGKRQKEFGQFQCVSLKTGKTLWHTNEFSDPKLDMGKSWVENCDKGPAWLIVDGKIIIWTGAQVAIGKISPSGYQRISAFQLSKKGGGTWTALAFSNGRLFVRSGSWLYGVDLRGNAEIAGRKQTNENQ